MALLLFFAKMIRLVLFFDFFFLVTFLLIQLFRFSHLTNYIWCKLNHTFFNSEQDVYLCAPYFDPELFANIETDIAVFHRKGEHKCVASKFRVRNHNLKIETGRFTIPKTPEDLRICDHCSQIQLKMKWTYYFTVIDMTDDLRKTVYIKTNKRNTSFTNCKNHDKVCFLFQQHCFAYQPANC